MEKFLEKIQHYLENGGDDEDEGEEQSKPDSSDETNSK